MTTIQTSGVGNRLLGYGCPAAAAVVALVALYGPGSQDVSAHRSALAVFAAGAVLAAASTTLSTRSFLLSGTATGLFAVGTLTMPTAGSLSWFAAALLFAAIVDTHHVADGAGTTLGGAPLAGILTGLTVFAVLSFAL